MTAELRVESDADQNQAVTDALVAELGWIAAVIDNHEAKHWLHLKTSALAPLRDLIRAAGIPATPLPRRTR